MREVRKSAQENYYVAAFESRFADFGEDMYDHDQRDDWDDFLGGYDVSVLRLLRVLRCLVKHGNRTMVPCYALHVTSLNLDNSQSIY